MKLKRKEIIQQLSRMGCFPAKYGFRYVISEVRLFEQWQNQRFAA